MKTLEKERRVVVHYPHLISQSTTGLSEKVFHFDQEGCCVMDEEDAKYFLQIPGFTKVERDIPTVDEGPAGGQLPAGQSPDFSADEEGETDEDDEHAMSVLRQIKVLRRQKKQLKVKMMQVDNVEERRALRKEVKKLIAQIQTLKLELEPQDEEVGDEGQVKDQGEDA